MLHIYTQTPPGRIVSVAFVVLALAAPAAAQVVLNQAKANAGLGGCDTPGFPLTICKPGSYKLTGALTPTAPNQTLIQVATNAVTIDLNGFYIGGNCSLGSASGNGIETAGGPRTGITVLNGMVSCMGHSGISMEGDSHRVERVTATLNGRVGIFLRADSIVRNNTANANGVDGINAGDGVVVSGNTANRNGRYGITSFSGSVGGNVVKGNGEGDLAGSGVSLGNNVCTAGPC